MLIHDIFYTRCESDRNSVIVPQNVVLYPSRRTGIYQYCSSLKEKSALGKKTRFRRAKGETHSRAMRAFPFLVCKKGMLHYNYSPYASKTDIMAILKK